MKINQYFEKGRPFFEKNAVKPYIIAEAGVNHEGSIDLAKRLIAEAKEGGADAIKFQTYKADLIASKNSPYYWDLNKESTRSQHELFQKYDKFWKGEYELLKKECDAQDIEFLSTPFDVESATFLNEMMPVFKISSSDITNRPFIEFLCDFNKPIILSVGASYPYEMMEAVSWIEAKGNPLALLHCILNYPTENPNAHIGMVKKLASFFPDKIIGYSDHTLPENDMKACEMAFILGAVILEKHFTFDKTLPGNDHYHAMDKEDLKKFNQTIQRDLVMLKNFDFSDLSTQAPARKNARRSLVAKRFIPKGKTIEYSDLTFKRPASGISPSLYLDVLNKQTLTDIEEDTVLTWNMIKL